MNNKIFFSVYQSSWSDRVNFRNHEYIKGLLKSLNCDFVEINGVYKGLEELSLMVDSDNLDFVIAVATAYRQESILLVDEYGSVVLRYMDGGHEQELGEMIVTDRDYASDFDAYSYNPLTDEYYLAV
jgi:hypothetical protein